MGKNSNKEEVEGWEIWAGRLRKKDSDTLREAANYLFEKGKLKKNNKYGIVKFALLSLSKTIIEHKQKAIAKQLMDNKEEMK